MEPVDVSVVHFESADGTVLAGDLLTPPEPTGGVVVCHPHPLYGGTRRDAVVAAMSRAFVDAGRRVLRFDFRGAGGSSGSHDGGGAERDDLRAALHAMAVHGGPITIAGYSFGADIALSVDHQRADRWVVAAPPLAIVAVDEMVAPDDPRPVHVIAAEHDQFNPADRLGASVEAWTAVVLHTVPSSDHFFSGAHRKVGELSRAALSA